MKRALLLLVLLLAPVSLASSVAAQSPAPLNPGSSITNDQHEWALLKSRFEAYAEFLSGGMWWLIHGYRSKSQLDAAMSLIQLLMEAVEKNDPSRLKQVGGIQGFNARVLKLMKPEDDDTVAGFMTRVLAISGGKNYAPEIAALTKTRDKSWTEEFASFTTSRSQAAMTLSTMGLAEYKRDIAELLKSKSSVDKQGANYALAKLKATEYAEQIAGQLSGPQVEFLRDGSAIHALIDLGVGQKYKKQIGLVLTAANSSDVKKPAMYALAHLHATESAPAIATLLAENYLRADAAKALAIMGDHEHEAEIAAMIDDKDESAQSAAILALGILGARQYAPMIAKLLGKKESSVSYDAALSLLLMGAADYEREAAARLSTNKTGTYVSVNNFNGFNVLVADEVKEINKRVVLALERVKKQ